jgi:hypothetical protein
MATAAAPPLPPPLPLIPPPILPQSPYDICYSSIYPAFSGDLYEGYWKRRINTLSYLYVSSSNDENITLTTKDLSTTKATL